MSDQTTIEPDNFGLYDLDAKLKARIRSAPEALHVNALECADAIDRATTALADLTYILADASTPDVVAKLVGLSEAWDELHRYLTELLDYVK